MSETIATHDRKGAYRIDRDANAEPEVVQARIDQLSIPVDVHDRANDVANHFTRPEDLQMLLAAIHDVAVPGYATRETDFAAQADNGREAGTVLAQPHERASIFVTASEMIRELSSMRSGEQLDQAFLDRVGNIVAIASVWAHTYADGNGRTARITADLLRYGPESGNLAVAMKNRDEYGPGDIRISSYVPKNGLSAKEALRAAASLDVPMSDEHSYAELSGSAFSTPYTG